MKIINKIVLTALITLIPFSISPSSYNPFKEKISGVQVVEGWYERCSQKYGCHRGNCWAGCAGAINDANGAEWCYAVKSNNDWATCSSNSDCSGCWKCGSSCSL